MSRQTTPLAWKNLVHDPRRCMLAVAGIAFAVMLMFQQRGFNHALFDSTVELVQKLDTDILVFNPARFALSNEVRFNRSQLDIVASVPGVDRVVPLYIENLAARLRRDGLRARPIRVLSWDLAESIWLDPSGEFGPQQLALRAPRTALMDRWSKSHFGFHPDRPTELQAGELAGRPLTIVGWFELGTDFAHEGNLIMALDNFVEYFAYRSRDPRERVDLGIVRVSATADPNAVARDLERVLGRELRVLTKPAFVRKEIGFWARNTPIGVIFAVGAVIGFAVGVIICYQILATDIAEHLSEFATLKAMGYSNRYFVGLVIRQALYLAGLGFLPGWGLSWLLFQFNSQATGLLMRMTWDRVGVIVLATVVMCVVSGLLALRKLLAADPASLF